ncbi:Pathogenesis-related protein PR-1 [Linum grandiflorum]
MSTLIILFLCFLCLTSATAAVSRRTTTSNTPPHIVKQFLAPHNRERSRLGIPPLKWSNKLANFAASWARQRRGDCQLVHSGGSYGENLFWGSGGGWRRGDAVAAWAAERSYYDHAANSCTENRQSTRIGCAKVVCRSGDTFVSCNYDPPGNFVGEKPF